MYKNFVESAIVISGGLYIGNKLYVTNDRIKKSIEKIDDIQQKYNDIKDRIDTTDERLNTISERVTNVNKNVEHLYSYQSNR